MTMCCWVGKMLCGMFTLPVPFQSLVPRSCVSNELLTQCGDNSLKTMTFNWGTRLFKIVILKMSLF